MAAHASSHAAGNEELNYLNWKTGIWSWLSSTDHKRICFLYLFSIMIFFMLGGLAALVMRLELATAGPTIPSIVKDSHTYNIIFTMHGVFMIFLFVVPGIPATLGNFLIPLMIGADDMVFPRVNRLSFQVFFIYKLLSFNRSRNCLHVSVDFRIHSYCLITIFCYFKGFILNC